MFNSENKISFTFFKLHIESILLYLIKTSISDVFNKVSFYCSKNDALHFNATDLLVLMFSVIFSPVTWVEIAGNAFLFCLVLFFLHKFASVKRPPLLNVSKINVW